MTGHVEQRIDLGDGHPLGTRRDLHDLVDERLAGALAALFKENAPASAPSRASAKTALAGPEADRAQEALSHYNGAIQQLKSGNWAGFDAELDALRPLLEELSQHSAGREPVEEAPPSSGPRTSFREVLAPPVVFPPARGRAACSITADRWALQEAQPADL